MSNHAIHVEASGRHEHPRSGRSLHERAQDEQSAEHIGRELVAELRRQGHTVTSATLTHDRDGDDEAVENLLSDEEDWEETGRRGATARTD